MKKIYFVLIAVAVLVISAYLYLRYSVLKTKDFKPDTSKSVSPLDLRPAIIAKLQQIVKDGSHGLYNLSIGELEPGIVASTVKVLNAVLTPDSAVLSELDKARRAPDDVFKISFSSLRIRGIGIHDLLHRDEINMDSIYFSRPVIEIYHTSRAYNRPGKQNNDSLTIYRQLMKNMKRIFIGNILIEHGTVINHNISGNNRTSRFNDVMIKFSNVLIDSTTQYVRDRFLFAEGADISFKDYSFPTADSLYYFKAASVSISVSQHKTTILNLSLTPRGSREQFEKKLPGRQDMYTLRVPKITLDDIDWYSILNEDKILIREGTVWNCNFSDYFNRSLPEGPSSGNNNFPHQLLMRMALPVYIQKINLKNCAVRYEEFNPASGASGTIYFDDVNGQLSNITNMREYIRRNSKMKLSATALFLRTSRLSTVFNLDLKNYKKGNFAVDVSLGKIDSTAINPAAGPLGLVSVKRGHIKKVDVHISGTNAGATGRLLLLYDDLHLVPLKKDKEGQIKKRSFTDFLANLILIRNANPANGKQERFGKCDFKRSPNSSFFNLIWKTVLTGVLNTIGLPVKFAYK